MHYLGLFCFGVMGCFIAFGKNLKESKNNIFSITFLISSFLIALINTTNIREHVVGIAGISFIVYLAKSPGSSIHKILSWRPLTFIGTFAYSTYLVHAPLIQILWQYPLAYIHNNVILETILLGTVGLILIYGTSYIFYIMFENPCHSIAKKISAL